MIRVSAILLRCTSPRAAVRGGHLSVSVSPSSIEIKHHRQPHAIQVLGTTADGYSARPARRQAKFASANPKVAAVDERAGSGPLASGQTTDDGDRRRADDDGAGEGADLRRGAADQLPPRGDAGADAGRLQRGRLPRLFARQERLQALAARRTTPTRTTSPSSRTPPAGASTSRRPERACCRPSRAATSPHEGGVRFRTRQPVRRHPHAAGSARARPSDLKDTGAGRRACGWCPTSSCCGPGRTHRVQLIAEYSDGTTRDVTRLGIFTANNDRFAAVDDEGLVTAGDAGETAIVGRFERTFAATGVIVLDADAERSRRRRCRRTT